MNSENHYYVAGYSLDDDPYCHANGVLVNKLEITNTQDLNEVEAELAALAISNLLSLASPKEFSTSSLINIHREIFLRFILGLENFAQSTSPRATRTLKRKKISKTD